MTVDSPDWMTAVTQGQNLLTGSPFVAATNTTTSKDFTLDLTARAVAIVVDQQAHVNLITVTGKTSGVLYLNQQILQSQAFLFAPVLQVVDPIVTVAVQTNANGSSQVWVVSVDDVEAMTVFTNQADFQVESAPGTVVRTRQRPYDFQLVGSGGVSSVSVNAAPAAGTEIEVDWIAVTVESASTTNSTTEATLIGTTSGTIWDKLISNNARPAGGVEQYESGPGLGLHGVVNETLTLTLGGMAQALNTRIMMGGWYQ